jgi:hypothetical protein
MDSMTMNVQEVALGRGMGCSAGKTVKARLPRRIFISPGLVLRRLVAPDMGVPDMRSAERFVFLSTISGMRWLRRRSGKALIEDT